MAVRKASMDGLEAARKYLGLISGTVRDAKRELERREAEMIRQLNMMGEESGAPEVAAALERDIAAVQCILAALPDERLEAVINRAQADDFGPLPTENPRARAVREAIRKMRDAIDAAVSAESLSFDETVYVLAKVQVEFVSRRVHPESMVY